MGTFVTVEVIQAGTGLDDPPAIDRAFDWFRQVETCCTRFDPSSELMRLTQQVGVAVPVSAILFEALQFAVAVAVSSDGAFDPTVGRRMEANGFDRHYETGVRVGTAIDPDDTVSYLDLRVDPGDRTVTLLRPLVLDLGGVAKGLAIDLAAAELRPYGNFCIDAGGDVYVSGCNANGTAWHVGISDPRGSGELHRGGGLRGDGALRGDGTLRGDGALHGDGALIDALHRSNAAICTSGDYERRAPRGAEHHIIHPRTGRSANAVASATVVAPSAMVADAMATAAFVMAADGSVADTIAWLEAQGVDGLLVTSSRTRYATSEWGGRP